MGFTIESDCSREVQPVQKTEIIQNNRQNYIRPSSARLASDLKQRAWDYVVLAAVALLPTASYLSRLGIYADDWGFFARFRANGDRTLVDLLRTFDSFPRTRSRPVMQLYEAGMFRLFGFHHLGYYFVNTLVFFASAVLLYRCLRLILRERFIALVIPIAFIVLPNYSGARFVPCAFAIGLSMALLFLNLYALLKAVASTKLLRRWAVISIAALVTSCLAYEVALPLFVLNFLVAWKFERKKPVSDRLQPRAVWLLLVLNAMALVAVTVFKKLTTTRYHGFASVGTVIQGAVKIHFYQFGLRLPVVVAKSVLVYWNPARFAIALFFGVFLSWYLWRIQHDSDCSWDLKKALRLTAFGFLVFAGGHAIFLVSAGETGFTATGFESRTAIAASLGMAIILAGAAMCIGLLMGSYRKLMTALLIASLCACELLVTSTIGSFWAVAAERQQSVLNSIRHDIPVLPPHSVLLLDGVCPYIGPGIVFEGGNDMSGSLQLLYHDPSLRGDVVTSRLQVHQDKIETRIYRHVRYYPYGPNLKLYDFRSKRVYPLLDLTETLRHFTMMGPVHTFCPEGNEGDGVPIF